MLTLKATCGAPSVEINFLDTTLYQIDRGSFVQGIGADSGGEAADKFTVICLTDAAYEALLTKSARLNNIAARYRETKRQSAVAYTQYRFDADAGIRYAILYRIEISSVPGYVADAGITIGAWSITMKREVGFRDYSPAAYPSQFTSGTIPRTQITNNNPNYLYTSADTATTPERNFVDLSDGSGDLPPLWWLLLGEDGLDGSSNTQYPFHNGVGTTGYDIADYPDGPFKVIMALKHGTAADMDNIVVENLNPSNGNADYTTTVSAANIQYYKGRWHVYGVAVGESGSAYCTRIRFRHNWGSAARDDGVIGQWAYVDDSDTLETPPGNAPNFMYLGTFEIPMGNAQAPYLAGGASTYWMSVETENVSGCTNSTAQCWGFILLPADEPVVTVETGYTYFMWIDSDRRVAFTTDGSYDTEAEPAYLSGEMFTVLPDYDNRLYVYCLGISPSTGKPVVLRGGGGVTVYQYVVSRYSGAR